MNKQKLWFEFNKKINAIFIMLVSMSISDCAWNLMLFINLSRIQPLAYITFPAFIYSLQSYLFTTIMFQYIIDISISLILILHLWGNVDAYKYIYNWSISSLAHLQYPPSMTHILEFILSESTNFVEFNAVLVFFLCNQECIQMAVGNKGMLSW